MAIGKNKKLKTGKKGAKKRAQDPFVRKEWYDIKAPNVFRKRNIGKTVITKTTGTKIASEGLKGRVFTVSLAELTEQEEKSFRNVKLRCEDVQGGACLTNFWGMDFTTDKLRSLVHKWQTLIEAFVDVKTLDGYMLRIFCIGFTRRQPNQLRKTSYAQTSQIRQIRKKMTEIMTKVASSCDLKHLVRRFVAESIGSTITRACERIYPLQDVFVRKVKVLKAPKFDAVKLAELHAEVVTKAKKKPVAAAEDTGVKVVDQKAAPAVPQTPLVGEQPQ